MTELEKSVREIPELLKVLKQKFTTPAPTPVVEAASVKTKDGKTLSYNGDTPQAGKDIMIVDEAGAKTPAPDGEYDIEIITEEGSEPFVGRSSLTGASIGVEESSFSVLGFFRYPVAWMFMILIMGFVVFMVVKKGYKRIIIFII